MSVSLPFNMCATLEQPANIMAARLREVKLPSVIVAVCGGTSRSIYRMLLIFGAGTSAGKSTLLNSLLKRKRSVYISYGIQQLTVA